MKLQPRRQQNAIARDIAEQLETAEDMLNEGGCWLMGCWSPEAARDVSVAIASAMDAMRDLYFEGVRCAAAVREFGEAFGDTHDELLRAIEHDAAAPAMFFKRYKDACHLCKWQHTDRPDGEDPCSTCNILPSRFEAEDS